VDREGPLTGFRRTHRRRHRRAQARAERSSEHAASENERDRAAEIGVDRPASASAELASVRGGERARRFLESASIRSARTLVAALIVEIDMMV
jgi:hypothetical protein